MTSTLIATDTSAWQPRDGAAPNAQRLLRGDGLTLVRISFREGQVLEEHRAPGPILIHCLSGTIDLDVTTRAGNESHRLDAGTVIHIAGGDPHRLAARHDAVVHVVLQRNVSEATG
ncbi:cupin domain-containing protein [Nocardia mexicana]|uniref:Quercetin dioxygenase-like cupin family protein n=1 Tax=Nocardia mexicana TaxID=279262 RepID=A0A370HDI4_9NOCA|nr:cupin domain-containing protein [Nocardia mexicana]RDI55303.1 quercetin dioxygenase-like cupin family protein [Nocardia mexicana]